VLTAGSGKEALEIVMRSAVDLVILDLAMPGMNGVDTFREIHTIRPALPAMIVTGYPDSELMAQALEIGPFAMMSKPLDLVQLQQTVDRIIASRDLIDSASRSHHRPAPGVAASVGPPAIDWRRAENRNEPDVGSA
jgi:DNA-binding NtrC family response regulator